MPQTRISNYLGPAFVLYLVAGVASLDRGLDLIGTLVSVVAVVLSFSVFVHTRHPDTSGSRRVGWMGLCTAITLVGEIHPGTLSLALELSRVVALSGLSGLLIDLSLSVPDRPPVAIRHRIVRALSLLLVLVCCISALVAVAPPVKPFRSLWLTPSWVADLPLALSAIAIVFSLGVRGMRRRWGSGPEMLASNVWAVLGLIPGAILALISLLMWLYGPVDFRVAWYRGALAFTATCLVLGHILMIDPRRGMISGIATRNAVAAALTLVVAGVGVASIQQWIPQDPLTLGLSAAGSLFLSAGIYRVFHSLGQQLLLPFGGRLIEAVDRVIERLAFAQTLEEVTHAVLVPLREASGTAEAEPFLYCLDPPHEARIDAAGQPHLSSRPLSDAIVQHFEQEPDTIIVTSSLQAQVVRKPRVRPLVSSLEQLDALCVVPLWDQAQLLGVLIIPRGLRTSALTLEEIIQLKRCSRFVSAFVSIICAELRAQQRASDSALMATRAEERVAKVEEENKRLHADIRLLRMGQHSERLEEPPTAYSHAMSELLESVFEAALTDEHVLLLSEAGNDLAIVAYRLHLQSGRGAGAFIIADCSSVRTDKIGNALFGMEEDRDNYPGWLPLAQGGTLVLLDIPALPREIQRTLSWAMLTREAHRLDAEQPYKMDVRVIASSRIDLSTLVNTGSFDVELAKRFATRTLRVPALRERIEDLSSLILMELNRTSRVFGRDTVGIESDAMDLLNKYKWPGNLDELRWVIESAVFRCSTSRVKVTDLPPLSRTIASDRVLKDPLDGTFEVVERRILKQAIRRAKGNKSEAARALGLKRSTFIDKLRRHNLDQLKV